MGVQVPPTDFLYALWPSRLIVLILKKLTGDMTSFRSLPRFMSLSLEQNYELLAELESAYPLDANIGKILQGVDDTDQQGARQILKTALLDTESNSSNLQSEGSDTIETENSHYSSKSSSCGQESPILMQIPFGGPKRRPRPFKELGPLILVDKLLSKRRSTKNKKYRNDQLAKKIIRSIATNYHKWFLANITRSVRRNAKASQQRRELVHLLVHLGVTQQKSSDWVHDAKQRKILDTTFLSVGARSNRNALKRESIFNGTKRACIELFSSDIGKELYLESFVRMWKEFISKQEDEEDSAYLEKYLSSILESMN